VILYKKGVDKCCYLKKQRQAKPLVAWQQEFDDVAARSRYIERRCSERRMLTRALGETLRQQMSSVNDLMLKIPGYKTFNPQGTRLTGCPMKSARLKAQAERPEKPKISSLKPGDANAELLIIGPMTSALE